ncbi:IclR family transcriptional regulator [Streptosporangium sp. KLBMP 9127]|nr:IclR family transcriptional regulator [Streptosporangium sp. KLBMP 9127]
MTIQSAKTTLLVLEAVSEHQPVGLSELARTMEMSKTTVQRCLVTLAEAGWIRAVDPDRPRWVLTTRALTIGRRVGEPGSLRVIAMPLLSALQAYANETIHLMVPEARNMVLIERLDTSHELRTISPLGVAVPMHAIASGKAVLAAMADDAVEGYIARGLEPVTPRTVTDPRALREEITKIRRDGYAVIEEEWQSGVVAIAAAIAPGQGRPIASISISAPGVRVTPDLYENYGEHVRETAERIAGELRHR